MATGFVAILGKMQFALTRIITGLIFVKSTKTALKAENRTLKSRINTGSAEIEIVENFEYNLEKWQFQT